MRSVLLWDHCSDLVHDGSNIVHCARWLLDQLHLGSFSAWVEKFDLRACSILVLLLR
jgi:hypothetical protein